MKSKIKNADDDFGLDDDRPSRKPRSKPKRRNEYLGKLHELLTKGLPDFVDDAGILDTKKVADLLGISFQALYKWFERDQIPAKRIAVIVTLSKKQKKKGESFSPLVRDDFWEFLSQ